MKQKILRLAAQRYEPGATLIGERIALFRAPTYAEAIRKAEIEASQYASESHINRPLGSTLEGPWTREDFAWSLFFAGVLS